MPAPAVPAAQRGRLDGVVDRVELVYMHDPEHTTFAQATAPGGPVVGPSDSGPEDDQARGSLSAAQADPIGARDSFRIGSGGRTACRAC